MYIYIRTLAAACTPTNRDRMTAREPAVYTLFKFVARKGGLIGSRWCVCIYVIVSRRCYRLCFSSCGLCFEAWVHAEHVAPLGDGKRGKGGVFFACAKAGCVFICTRKYTPPPRSERWRVHQRNETTPLFGR